MMSHMLKWCWIETLQYTFKIFQAISRRIWDTHTHTQTETRTPILCNTLKPRREIVACLPNRLSFWPPQHHTWVLSARYYTQNLPCSSFCWVAKWLGLLPADPQSLGSYLSSRKIMNDPMDFHGRLVDFKVAAIITISLHHRSASCMLHTCAQSHTGSRQCWEWFPCSHLQWWCQRQLCLQGPAEWRNRSTHYKCNLMPAGSCRLLHSCRCEQHHVFWTQCGKRHIVSIELRQCMTV